MWQTTADQVCIWFKMWKKWITLKLFRWWISLCRMACFVLYRCDTSKYFTHSSSASMCLSHFQSTMRISTCCDDRSGKMRACGPRNTMSSRCFSVILMDLSQCWCWDTYCVRTPCLIARNVENKWMLFIVSFQGGLVFFCVRQQHEVVKTHWFCSPRVMWCKPFMLAYIYQQQYRLLSIDDAFFQGMK